MSESESLPQVVVDEAWCEYVYPRTAIGDLNHPPPQGGFMRATRVYQLWARKHDEYWSGLLELTKRKAREQTADELDRQADSIHSTIQAWGYGPNDDPPGNSIAGALCNVAVELRERASVLRGEGQTDG